jgi:hypothetical protein
MRVDKAAVGRRRVDRAAVGRMRVGRRLQELVLMHRDGREDVFELLHHLLVLRCERGKRSESRSKGS